MKIDYMKIDYMKIQEKWKSSVLSVRTISNPDCNTDHGHESLIFRVRLNTRKLGRRPVCYDMSSNK